jgi:hypothetical protein
MCRAALLLTLLAGVPHCQAQESQAIETSSSCDLASLEEPTPVNHLHLQTDYLNWYLRRLRVPALLTVGPAGSSGIPGDEGVNVIRGDDRMESRHDRYVGIRSIADYWFGDERTWALQADIFFLERDSTHFTAQSSLAPTLAIPFFGVRAQQELAYVVNGFNPQSCNVGGGTTIYSRMELFGQEANMLLNLCRSPCFEWNLLAGGRFLQLRERLDLTSSSRVQPDQAPLLGLEDHFQTFDKFYGGQVGTIGTWKRGRWSVEGKAAVALGADEEIIRNKGTRIFQISQERQVQNYGLFVQPSNSGEFDRTSFNVVTELRLNVGFELTQHISIRGGYTLLTWNGPVRPGDQVVGVNQSQTRPQGLQGPLAPLPQFREDFFFAHGANVGLEFRW